MDHTPHGLTAAEIEAFGQEMDAIRRRVLDDLGERDADYIRGVVALQRRLEVLGRSLFFVGFLPPAWLGGVAALSLSKILDNMEIGHNVMHGQYDWMGDPALDSRTFEWDTACPADAWRHSHNYMHHTYTNVVGKDRDVGYGVLRMSEDQPWSKQFLLNPVYALALASLFQWGVALHDLETDRVMSGDKPLAELAEPGRAVARKGGRQALKDYVLFPLLTGPSAPLTLVGNATANLARNLWAFTIIFCGHFPDGVAMFDEADLEGETRGEWYVRQVLGSANIEGGRFFHVMSGNLSHQIEHHLFPDLPAHRYAEVAPEVRDACRRYGLAYNSGGLVRQFGGVVRRIVRLALPGRRNAPKAPEPVPLTAEAA